MNNREHWSPEEQAMQNALDRIRNDYPDFWKDLSDLEDLSDLKDLSSPDPVSVSDPREVVETPDLEKIRRRKSRRRLIAAFGISVCIVSTFLAIFINSDCAHAMKFAMEKKYYQAKGWIQATEPGRVNENNVMIVIETDEAKISRYEEFWEPLMYPGYMTEGYVYDKLKVEKYVNGAGFATYSYVFDQDSIKITMIQNKEISNNILWITSESIRNGTCEYRAWYDENTGNNGIDVIIDNISITVRGNVDIDELIRIVNGLE